MTQLHLEKQCLSDKQGFLQNVDEGDVIIEGQDFL